MWRPTCDWLRGHGGPSAASSCRQLKVSINDGMAMELADHHWISWIGGSQWLQILQYKLCHDHVVSKTTIWIYLIGRIPLGFICIYQVCHLRPYILAVFVAVLAVLYLLHGKRFPLKLWPLETNSRHDQHASVVSLGNTMSSSTSKHDVHTHVHKYIQL